MQNVNEIKRGTCSILDTFICQILLITTTIRIMVAGADDLRSYKSEMSEINAHKKMSKKFQRNNNKKVT